MEHLEIHSRSYLVRWVEVPAEHSIFFNIQPQKKSILFGIFKHPGHSSAPTPKFPSLTFEPPPTPDLRLGEIPIDSHSSRNASSTATEKLKSIGLKLVSWYGICEANKVSTGKYDVPSDEGGMYALVFDNTFAKQLSKSVTFVLLTYPTKSPPQSNHHMHHIQGSSAGSGSNLAPRVVRRESSDSVIRNGSLTSEILEGSSESRVQNPERDGANTTPNFFTGMLQKRRRKRGQGYARRFFSLDYTTSTLSYYHNRNTLALRGAVPLSLAAIGANAATRQISIDSGAEIWHLRATTQKDFEAWKNALEIARATFNSASLTSDSEVDIPGMRQSLARLNVEQEIEWAKVENLAKRVQHSRDVARNLAKDTDPKYLAPKTSKPAEPDLVSVASGASESLAEQTASIGYFNEGERMPFWRRKPSSERTMPGMFRRSFSAQPSLTSSSTSSTPPIPSRAASFVPENNSLQSHPEESLHDHCMALLRDLDSVVADFAIVIAESKQRRPPLPKPRHSIDSVGSQEFFDAEGGTNSQLLAIHQESDDEIARGQLITDGEDSASGSDVDGPASLDRHQDAPKTLSSAFPSKPKSLIPLPISQSVKRRNAIPPPTVNPPSLIGFLRKNVGKELSTISMPVSANEPISLLQRISEQLEYSNLLDDAVTKAKNSGERLLYVSAFAVSTLSNTRVKERAIRKPFNPMLGETFELVREDKGFRFIAEKVSHRPVHLACQAESETWSFTQSPMPTQKFWGKSAELVTEGRVRIVLHPTGDRFSWTPATNFLRNIIAGEKYIEPVGTMKITNETTGEHATITFKAKGMFSGRSEDVSVQIYDPFGDELPLALVGKWTTSLTFTSDPSAVTQKPTSTPPIWTVADLIPGVSKRYGLTTFAASLNEITAIEKGKLPPTDSRLRPDQRAAENGDFDTAEVVKAKLEEGQRERRRIFEEEDPGGVQKPKWFEMVPGDVTNPEEIWVAKGGKDGYWEGRERGRWDGVERVFDIQE